MTATTLLDDLAALVNTHGADEIVLHLDPTFGTWGLRLGFGQRA